MACVCDAHHALSSAVPCAQQASYAADSHMVTVSAHDVVRIIVSEGVPVKTSAVIASRITGKHKAPLYKLALAVRSGNKAAPRSRPQPAEDDDDEDVDELESDTKG